MATNRCMLAVSTRRCSMDTTVAGTRSSWPGAAIFIRHGIACWERDRHPDTCDDGFAELGDVRAEFQGEADANGLRWCGPSTWLAESRELAQRYAYTEDVLTPVRAASRGLGELEPIKLPDAYFERAGAVARQRAKLAGYRLALALSAPWTTDGSGTMCRRHNPVERESGRRNSELPNRDCP